MFMAFILMLLSLFSCQASFNIRPESLPKSIGNSYKIQSIVKDQSENFEGIYKNHRATVVIFWQISCPCVKRYQARIEKLYRRYHNNNIAFLYVSSNTNESYEQIKKEYLKRSIALPLYQDEQGNLAQAIGAKGTPTAAIINQSGEIVFLGWPDNERNEHEKGRIAYLENAIDDIIHNRQIKTPTSPMFGCPIR